MATLVLFVALTLASSRVCCSLLLGFSWLEIFKSTAEVATALFKRSIMGLLSAACLAFLAAANCTISSARLSTLRICQSPASLDCSSSLAKKSLFNASLCSTRVAVAKPLSCLVSCTSFKESLSKGIWRSKLRRMASGTGSTTCSALGVEGMVAILSSASFFIKSTTEGFSICKMLSAKGLENRLSLLILLSALMISSKALLMSESRST